MAHHFNHADWRAAFPSDWPAILASLLLIETLTCTPPLVPVVTWALTCEICFYAFVLGGITACRIWGDTTLMLGATLLAFAVLAGLVPVLGWLFNFWPQFACGLLLLAAVRQWERHSVGRTFAALAGILALAVAAGVDSQWRIAGAAMFALLLFALKPFDQSLCQRPDLRWLAWIGSISYPLFLLHVSVGGQALALGQRVVPPDSGAFLLVLLAATLASVLTAWCVHHGIERSTRTWARQPASPAT